MKNNKGFTLIEIIATLVLSGILAGIAGMGLVQMSKSFVFTKQNMGTLQKGQLAMLRILKEFTNISSISASNNTSITFVSEHRSGGTITYALSLSGTTLLLQKDGGDQNILVNNVNDFDLLYYDTYDADSANTWTNGTSSLIQATLDLNGAGGVVS